MGTNLMGELVANNGTFILNTPNYTAGDINIDAIVVLEDTIFDVIYIGDGEEVKSTYISDASSIVRAGAIITPLGDVQFTGVALVSGSVALVLG
jgi:hypothetical protein